MVADDADEERLVTRPLADAIKVSEKALAHEFPGFKERMKHAIDL